jgi:multiple sugar transport system substrate-binding protein
MHPIRGLYLPKEAIMAQLFSRRVFLKAVTAGASVMAAGPLLGACVAPAQAPASGETGGRRFEGQTLSVAGMSWMWEATQPLYEQFLDETGIQLEMATFQQQEITDKLMQAVATNTYFADLLGIESNVSADVWGAGACLEVPDEIISDPAMDWDDVLPVYRDKILSWEGKVYGMPFDGDTHHLMFLHTILDDADNQQNFQAKYGYAIDTDRGPHTWDEHRDYAEFFTGWDWNGDGEPNYGFAHMMKRGDTAFWGFISRSTAYAKHPDDPGFFFDLDTGEPRINSPAFVRALTEWKDELQFGPPGMLSYGWGEVIQATTAGRCAMNVGWDGVATYGEGSQIKGQASFSVLPGSYEVYNAKEGSWENRPDINYAPYLAFGGWLISIAKGTNNPEAAFELAKFFTDKEHGNRFAFEGYRNPIRVSEVADPTPWMEGRLQFTERSAKTYIRALNETMTHPNLVLDLRMPGWTQYRDAVELAVSKGLAGEAEPQAALDEAAETWKAVMDRLGGADKQLQYYKIHLGVE